MPVCTRVGWGQLNSGYDSAAGLRYSVPLGSNCDAPLLVAAAGAFFSSDHTGAKHYKKVPFYAAPTVCADLDALRPFTAVLRRRGLTNADPALEHRFMAFPEAQKTHRL